VAERDRVVEGATAVAIDLDAAIFDDGTLVGANQDGWLSELFGTYVAAKQEWYRTILAGLDAGQSLEDAYAPLRAFSAESIRQMHARGPMDPRERRRSMWRTQAAGEASSWLRRFPASEVPGLLRGLRLEPFAIEPRG
jgi:phosphoserine phosphatase